MVHCLLNLAYGVAIVSLIHGAVRQPSLFFAVGFGFIMMEFAFAMATVMLSRVLGELAWVRIFVGSLIGAGIAIAMLSRTHPLAAGLRQAEDETGGFSAVGSVAAIPRRVSLGGVCLEMVRW